MESEFFQTIIDFFQFKLLIAENVLTIFYILCSLLIPLAAWYFLFWIIRRYALVIKFYKDTQYSLFYSLIMWVVRKIKFFKNKIDEKITWQSLTISQKLKFLGLYIAMVGLAEIFLRLIFEYLIAFLQMHEWLKPPTL
ncbi:MAG: hypothetical protein QNJ56_10810 [Gammaproteobacteria bacterium]|nr:hypothetical protein [Gammaproteobacteria bacterium]